MFRAFQVRPRTCLSHPDSCWFLHLGRILRPTTPSSTSRLSRTNSRTRATSTRSSNRINTYGVIVHVKTLFSGHPELVHGFNVVLPRGYEIKLQDLEMKPIVFMKNLLNKIKSRFQQEDYVYNSFLGILDMHSKSMQDAYMVLFVDT